MKKILCLSMIILISLSFISCTNINSETKVNEYESIFTENETQSFLNNSKTIEIESDYDYVNNGEEVQINGYKGNGGYIKIPDTIEGNPVTRIAPNAFSECENITGIVFSENLKYIGSMAFNDLKSLSNVLVFPKSMEEIDFMAFSGTNIKGFVIQSDCKIGNHAVDYTNSMEFIYVKNGSRPYFDLRAFDSSSISIAVIPSSCILDEDVFAACNKLTIYTPKDSGIVEYANKNFIRVNTDDYDSMVEKYSNIYN